MITLIFERFYWALLLLALLVGLFMPQGGSTLSHFLLFFLMGILFLTYAKLDIGHIIHLLKKPLLIGYILGMYLLIIPAAVYIIMHNLYPEIALGTLLLTALPPGLSIPFLTHMTKGNVPLSVVISFFGNLVAPFTIVFLLKILVHTNVTINLMGIFSTLIAAIFIPLTLAIIVRKLWKKMIQQSEKYFSTINIFLLIVITYTVIANQASTIKNHLSFFIIDTIVLYLLFIIYHLTGYFVCFWRKKEDKIALSVGKAYMNNALGLVVATSYFAPQVVLFVALSELPWVTMLKIFYHIVHRKDTR